MVNVYIGIGGNLGDRVSNINIAVNSLSEHLYDISCSQMYSTEPRDYYDQDSFINIVVKGTTNLSSLELLKFTQSVEKGGGRVRDKKIPKGPRTIDLDILLYGNEILKLENLIVPHPSMNDRKFVLIPLLEIEPDLLEPHTELSYFSYLETIESQGVYCSSLNDYNNLFL